MVAVINHDLRPHKLGFKIWKINFISTSVCKETLTKYTSKCWTKNPELFLTWALLPTSMVPFKKLFNQMKQESVARTQNHLLWLCMNFIWNSWTSLFMCSMKSLSWKISWDFLLWVWFILVSKRAPCLCTSFPGQPAWL